MVFTCYKWVMLSIVSSPLLSESKDLQVIELEIIGPWAHWLFCCLHRRDSRAPPWASIKPKIMALLVVDARMRSIGLREPSSEPKRMGHLFWPKTTFFFN